MAVRHEVRQAVTPQLLAAMTDRIVEEFHPLQVILFGSHARGDARPNSDVDLLVVMPNGEREGASADMMASLREFRVRNDVLVATPETLARKGHLVGYVFKPALEEGRVLHGADRRFPVKDHVMSDERDAIVSEWLRLASGHLRSARLALSSDGFPDAAYLAQQAAEKFLKAVLVFEQVQYPFTHELDEILSEIPKDWKQTKALPTLRALAKWAIDARYPGSLPTQSEAQQSISDATAVRDAVQSDLAERGFERQPQEADGG